ncbi:methionine-R-sulfoxide reductase B3 isoform X5 [Pseudopipra pipra]|uniref:methionine-R-sulfoxide reductase B3 isoform X5 n=1 Tax=Pseudopipra pipra TaxID=415032 RepID=UPI0031395C8C
MGSRRPPRAAGPRRAGGARLPAPCSYLALAAGAQEFPVMLAGRRARHCAPAGGPGPLARSLGPLPMRAAPPPLLPALCLALAAAARAAGSCRDKKDCKVVFSQEELRKRLTPLQYHVTQEKGTESAFEGEYTHHKAQGIYKCVVCGTPLFKSETKFDSNSESTRTGLNYSHQLRQHFCFIRPAMCPAVLQSLGAAAPGPEMCCLSAAAGGQQLDPARLTRKLQLGYGKNFQNQKYFNYTFWF